MENQTIVVFTSRGFWGKANNLMQALKNAKYTGEEKLLIFFIPVKEGDVGVNEGGDVRAPLDTKIYTLTNTFERVPFDPFVGFDQVVRKMDESGRFDEFFTEDVDNIEYSEELQELKEELTKTE